MQPPAPSWIQDSIDEMNAAERSAPAGILPEHETLDRRARAYSSAVAGWLQAVETPGDRDPADPRSVLARGGAVIPAKVYRALSSLRLSRDGHGNVPADWKGPANAVLLSIDRSQAAWRALVERGIAPATEVEPFVSELRALGAELKRLL